MYGIILCGGSGTRLWPLSRQDFPKQFLKLNNNKSLLQETYFRLKDIMPAENIYLITNQDNHANVWQQISEIEENFSHDKILIEPASLNTAPAITYGIKYLGEKAGISPEDPILFLPADHYIKNKEKFSQCVTQAMQEVGKNVGTIGITPTRPETGYGYIKKGERQSSYCRVEEFKEKPDRRTASKYLKSGQYLWNSGMYIFNIRSFATELRKHSPEIYSFLIKELDDFLDNFFQLPDTSIDFAIAEKSDNIVVFEGNFGWSDVGCFDSLAEIELSQNKVKHIHYNSRNIFAYSASDKLIATSGVDDLIVVENEDSILVQKKGRSEEVKNIVNHLKKNQAKELKCSSADQYSWGCEEILKKDNSYKIKKITVHPGEKINCQFHYHKSKHWTLIKGVGKLKKDKEVMFLTENKSVFIPPTVKHSLENPGKLNLEIIETQIGNYLEDDDLVSL